MATVIIPAAGMGTRMGSPPHGKEMLPEPNNQMRPLIDWSIQHALDAGHRVVLITNDIKYQLRNHVRQMFPKVEHCILGHVPGDWADSVIASASMWGDVNLLMLPDVRFEPIEYIKELPSYIDEYVPVAFGLQKIKLDEVNKFGIVDIAGRKTVEKPDSFNPGPLDIWGAWSLIAFEPVVGLQLFATYSERGKWLQLPKGSVSIFCNWSKDITRSGKITSDPY